MAGTTDPATAGAAATRPPNIWCIRADNGKYTDLLVREGYIRYGGGDWPDLNPCQTRADIFAQLTPLPRFQGKSKPVISAYARMISFPIGNAAAAGPDNADTTAPRRR